MTNIQTKDLLIKQLECTKHTFHITSYAVTTLWHLFEEDKFIPNCGIMPKNMTNLNNFSSDEYFKFYDSLTDKKESWQRNCGDAFNSAERVYIRETFEWIVDYANYSNQQVEFESQPWFRTAKVLRNAVSHNWIIKDFNTKHEMPYLLEHGSISYYGIAIKLEDVGKSPFTLGWNRNHTMLLCDEILNFAHTLR